MYRPAPGVPTHWGQDCGRHHRSRSQIRPQPLDGAGLRLHQYFRYLTEENFIQKNPMQSVPMMKKANFLAAQDKECLPEQEQVTVFTPTEIAKFKREAFSTFSNGKRKYQQAAAYILMLNTGLRHRPGAASSPPGTWRKRGLAKGRTTSRTRPGCEGWQAEIGHQQTKCTAE